MRFLARLNRSIHKRLRSRRFTRIGDLWEAAEASEAFQHRKYSTYEDYLRHQKAKLGIHELQEYDIRYRAVLRERLATRQSNWKGASVLCLAARIGTEVRAFLDLGCFAAGIDLNPGKENQYVVYGDFHDLQFAAESVDFVFTNSLDHAFDVKRVTSEVQRVLKPTGHFIVEAVAVPTEGKWPGFFESFYWSRLDDLVALIASCGFIAVGRTAFDYPWKGEQIWFAKAALRHLDA